MKQLLLVRLAVVLISYPYWVSATSLKAVKILAEHSDVVISDDGVNLKCDQFICPENASRCRVVKNYDALKPNVVQRTSYCYTADGDLLTKAQRKVLKKGNFHKYLDMSADRYGVVVINEEMATGFHLLTKNLATLQGKPKKYVKSIERTVNDVKDIVAHKISYRRHKHAIQ